MTNQISWILYDTDLSTPIVGGDLPVQESRIDIEVNRPGSAEIKLDKNAAPTVTEGMYCQSFYKGSPREGFFVENIPEVDADSSENAGQVMTLRGPGLLSFLSDAIIWDDGSGSTTRIFTGTRAGILLDLIVEAQARGALQGLVCDFTDLVDTNSVAWTDDESLSFPVGTNLLEVFQELAQSGIFEGRIGWVDGGASLSLYKDGYGTNLSNTVYFRIGGNCLEVSSERRSTSLKNAFRVKYKEGYFTAEDGSSMGEYRRREKLLSIEQAQTLSSASTYASVQLENAKDPLKSITLQLSEAIEPTLYTDYEAGDTVTLDRFGTEQTWRILSLQIAQTGEEDPVVHVSLNHVFVDSELATAAELQGLLNQWNTAHDAGELEVPTFENFGEPNGPVYAMHRDGRYLYLGGDFTEIALKGGGTLPCSNIARYDISSKTWHDMYVGVTGIVTAIGQHEGRIYVFGSARTLLDDHELLSITVSGEDDWQLVFDVPGSFPAYNVLSILSSEGYLYLGGVFLSSGDYAYLAAPSGVLRVEDDLFLPMDKPAGSTPTGYQICRKLVEYNGDVYGTFYLEGFGGGGDEAKYALQKLIGGSLSTVLDTSEFHGYNNATALAVYGDDLVFLASTYPSDPHTTAEVLSYDGSFPATTILGTVTDFTWTGKEALTVYLSDLYLGGVFEAVDAVASYSIAKLSGGTWSSIPTSAIPSIYAIEIINAGIYFAGSFSPPAVPFENAALYFPSFEAWLSHGSGSPGSFDLANAIHGATFGTLTTNSELVFWDNVSQRIRKITWGGIRTLLDLVYEPLITVLPASKGGTGIANTNTLTLPAYDITLGGGDVAQTYTLPAAGGTFALLNAANVFTGLQAISIPLATSGNHLDLKYDTVAYATAASQTPSTVTNGWNTFTIRQVINTVQISNTGRIKIRLTFQASSSSAIAVGAVYIGHAASSGDAYDFESIPTQVTFGGSAGFSGAASSVTVSDDIWFTVEAGKNLIVAFWANGTSGYASRTSQTGWTSYYKAGNDTTTVNATGYTGPYGQVAIGLTLVEAGNPTPTSAFTFSYSGLTTTRPITTSSLITGGSLAITGATTLASTLAVTGASTLASLAVTGAATVGTTLLVTGAATLSSTLGVTGLSTLNGGVSVTRTLTATSGLEYGVVSLIYANSSGSSTLATRAGSFDTATTIGNAQNYTSGNGLIGIIGRATHQGTGTVSAMYGLNFILNNTSTGTVTGGTAMWLGLWSSVGSTYTTVTAIDINTSSLLGTVVNAYGINIRDIKQGSTLNYAIKTLAGDIVFNNGGDPLGDFTWRTDTYNGIFGDASNESIVIMSNTAGKVGFWGATAVAQQVLATGGGATVDNVISLLQTLGLCKQS